MSHQSIHIKCIKCNWISADGKVDKEMSLDFLLHVAHLCFSFAHSFELRYAKTRWSMGNRYLWKRPMGRHSKKNKKKFAINLPFNCFHYMQLCMLWMRVVNKNSHSRNTRRDEAKRNSMNSLLLCVYIYIFDSLDHAHIVGRRRHHHFCIFCSVYRREKKTDCDVIILNIIKKEKKKKKLNKI